MENDCIALLTQKRDALKKILSLTEEEGFSDESAALEQRIDKYAALYDKREGLFQTISDIDGKLNKAEQREKAHSVPSSGSELQRRLKDECREAIRAIIALEEKNSAVAECLMANVKDSLKGIKQGRTASAHYHDVGVPNSGIYYDKKN